MTLSPTEHQTLTLFSRKGCCLCQGLEERLRALDLSALKPPLLLEVVDIDAPDCSPELRARFDLEVPVLTLVIIGRQLELPRVSPRLSDEGLLNWLQRACSKALGSD
ncbi:MAG: hypothetical protein RLZZ216_1341 [Cyanobacteriota bacterium]